MLYLVSGASRSGKTMIAEEIMRRAATPYMSLDWLVMGFTNGIPEYGIHDKLWPHEIAERLWPFLEAALESMLWSEVDCVIEGEAMLPEQISGLVKAHPDRMRICFLGFSDVGVEEKVRQVKQFSDRKGDWLINESDSVIRSHIGNMIDYSKRIKADCTACSLPYIDTSFDFETALEDAITALMT